MSQIFAPWKKDFQLARLLWFAGIVWLVVATLWNVHDYNILSIIIAFGSVLPFYYGFQNFEKGCRRRHGIVVEKKAITAFEKCKPDNWNVYIDWSLGERGGNLDLVVRFSNGDRCTIDVKSWHNWQNKSWWARDKAIRQVHRQRREMSIRNGVVWLPEARVAHACTERGIAIIEGDPNYLLQELHKLIRFDVTVKFRAIPPESLRELLKKRYHFHWDKKNRIWEGKCTEKEINTVKRDIEKQGGQVFIAGQN